MNQESLFHISDNPRIKVFEPLPAPFYSNIIMGKVVFAINNKMLHNYLLPRDCPRVTFYAGAKTTEVDKNRFLGNTTARYVVCVESAWLAAIQRTTVYSYEFSPESFVLFDECAGYYISYSTIIPVSARPVYNLMEEMLKRDVELRFMPSIIELGKQVQQSTLNFSLIRIHHAAQNGTDNNNIIPKSGQFGKLHRR